MSGLFSFLEEKVLFLELPFLFFFYSTAICFYALGHLIGEISFSHITSLCPNHVNYIIIYPKPLLIITVFSYAAT